jgi:hypothetical protein
VLNLRCAVLARVRLCECVSVCIRTRAFACAPERAYVRAVRAPECVCVCVRARARAPFSFYFMSACVRWLCMLAAAHTACCDLDVATIEALRLKHKGVRINDENDTQARAYTLLSWGLVVGFF